MSASTRSLHTVASADGTMLRYVRSGNGSPILLVHGGGADASSMVLVAKELAERHTVLLLERRGRDRPIPPAEYAIEREHEDLVAVAADIDEPVHVFAHSYGGLCTLGAATLDPGRFRAITLYEPPIPTPQHPYATAELLAEIEALLTGGDPEEAALLFLRSIVRVPEEELAPWRAQVRDWQAQVARAHVFRWEGPNVAGFRLDRIDLSGVTGPVTVLLGERNERFAPRYFASADALRAHVPTLRTVVLDGQFHLAMVSAPAALARAIEEAEAQVP